MQLNQFGHADYFLNPNIMPIYGIGNIFIYEYLMGRGIGISKPEKCRGGGGLFTLLVISLPYVHCRKCMYSNRFLEKRHNIQAFSMIAKCLRALHIR